MGADEKEEAMNSLRACISSRKGGVPFHELNGEYKELVGEYIPFVKLGYENLLSFLKEVPGVSLNEKDCIVRTVPTATTKHLHDLINKQKDKVKKFNTRYRPYKKTQPPLKSNTIPTNKNPTKTQPNQPKPRPPQKAQPQPTRQSNDSSRGSYHNKKSSYLGQYPYQQPNLNTIYENEFWLKFEELLTRYNHNGLCNDYESYWDYNQPTYMPQQCDSYQMDPYYIPYHQQAAHSYMRLPMYNPNRYDTHDYYGTYCSKYPPQNKKRNKRKYRPYNKKFNTFKGQNANFNQSTSEQCQRDQLWKGFTNVEYKSFNDDSKWLNNDYLWSSEVAIGEYQVIGDALMIHLLGGKQSDLCEYNMTIAEATHRITKLGCSNKVLIALGTIDILNGAGYEELTWKMQTLINTVISAGSYPVICTIPPMPGATGNYHAISARLTFNKWLWYGLKPQQIINLSGTFYQCGRINFKLFQKPSTNFLKSIWPLELWNHDGINLVTKQLNEKLLTTGKG